MLFFRKCDVVSLWSKAESLPVYININNLSNQNVVVG